MVAIGRSSHAFFFDGVSDSIIIPQGRFTKLGDTTSVGTNQNIRNPSEILSKTGKGKDETTLINSRIDDAFAIEAWVVPDCGGVIAEREGQFKLEMGTVDTPGPAKFTVHLDTKNGTKVYTLTTATALNTRWKGIVFPEQEAGSIHDSYNRYDLSNYNDATNLNFNHRPLYHVVGAITQNRINLYVNGQLLVSNYKPKSSKITDSTAHVYIGGKGGDFRGAVESIHFANRFDEQIITPNVPMDNGTSTTGLYRFEEPIDVINEEYTITALGSDSASPYSAATDGSTTTLTIAATDAQNLIARLTGKAFDSSNATIDFTKQPYSMGNYNTFNDTINTTKYVPHVPYNLIINPGAINRDTQKPNQSPPERLRILSINGTTGVITVNSIHLDYVVGDASGLRGIIHSRTVDVDDYFIIVPADILIDVATGKPFQPPHISSQIIDKTGQMILDETLNEQHGLVYSSQMATTTSHPNNPFAVVWPTDINEKYQIGHSGRHKFSHIEGHEYMRRFPKPTSLKIDQKITGSADIVEMDYSNTAKGVDRLFVKNQLADFYEENAQTPVSAIVNSSTASLVITNGLVANKEEIIAIDVEDHRPFMLKGPIPEKYNRTTLSKDERYYHLKPETESRVALLHVPTLRTTYNLAPYVEVHYNAIDLTGDSMQAQSTNPTPMLMVEKTVPKGSLALSSTVKVLDVIKADLADANKDSTIFSPGGFIELSSAVVNNNEYFSKTNSLIGDNTGGAEYDLELSFNTTPRKEDFSAGYTPPADANAQPATPPQVVASSHNKSTHPSVYHKLCIEPTSVDSISSLSDLGNKQFKKAVETSNSGAGVFDKGGVNQGSPIFEMFDIIDNIYIGSKQTSARIYIQPSNKSRTNQLQKMRDGVIKGKTPNIMSLYFLMSRTRIRSVKQIDDTESNSVITQITATGIAEEAINENVSLVGSGSPDSHIVKEIEPNAPVVSVTLGGPGQGAINTKPTYDPSPLMRLPGSTRRNCAVKAVSVCTLDTAKTMSVQPLNNNSEDIKSWGTYAFAKKGRIFLSDGANAEYSGKVGAGFFFDDANAIAQRKYVSSSGDLFSSFNDWCLGVDLISNQTKGTHSVNETIFNDLDFGYENLCEDGSTVNDRLFQTVEDVVHDYQLGTQYASTRAMVEIPVFPQQFFDSQADGIFPGPDNSMKLHLDATYTAHTWNPSPVGRRVDDIPPNDREANSAYSDNVQDKKYFTSTYITQITEDGNFLRLYVEDVNVFPKTLGPLDMNNFRNVVSNHRLFIENEWAYYTNDPITDGYVKIYNKPSTIGNGGYHGFNTKELFEKLTVGCKVSVGVSNPSLKSINSDITTQSSDYENRSAYYHDTGNVQTQGGNLDYGLRQYVSAVEFKAGPLSNPHAPRTKNKRAKATIIQGKQMTGQIYALELDNVEHFIDTNYTLDGSGNPIVGTGDLLVIGKVLSSTPVEVLYLGTQFNSQFSLNTTNNNTILVQFGTGVTVPSLAGVEFRLEKVGRSHLALSNIAQITSNELIVSTFRPTTTNEIWSFVGASSATSTTTLTIDCDDGSGGVGTTRSPIANTIGLNLRPGDMIYKESGSTIAYVGTVAYVHSRFHTGHATNSTIELTAANAVAIANDDKVRVGINSIVANDGDAILNKSWCNPYAAGGLRNGDTIWCNMTMNNAHAVEGLFAKSRGVFNEAQVYKAFNGGEGQLANRPRDSIPLENFLIGDTCLETAINFAQHVNKTVELNYEAMGLTGNTVQGSPIAPTVAYIDPYLASDGHARVLLYDVAHDREFISFHDIHMQVQTSPATPVIGHTRNLATKDGYYQLDNVLSQINGGAPHYLTTQIDVANGFPSENRYLRSTQQSKFIESAYAHNIANQTSNDLYPVNITGNPVADFIMENPLKGFGGSSITNIENEHYAGKGHGHVVHSGLYHESVGTNFHIADSVLPRVEPATQSSFYANKKHNQLRVNKGDTSIFPMVRVLKAHRRAQGFSTFTFKDSSTFFDTPDGTRVISAFLCLKGIRNEELNLINHTEGKRLKHLPQWKNMDYIRRQTIDFGEVGVKEGVTDIEAAAREIVRMINQGGAKNGRTHARRPSHQYPGESERMDLTRIGVREDVNNPNKDPASAHVNADFAATGSTHDPAPFWSVEHATTSQDRGSHMGYLRAHIGRVVEDINGVEGFTVVIHSTVPGASGRNFCAWLDNSKGQSPYQPQFLVGHGGRFRNFWCQQDEVMGENMHPAPMPLNKHGRPFAPITTLREMVKSENSIDDVKSNHDYISRLNDDDKTRVLSSHIGSGGFSNTIFDESFEAQSQSLTLVEGLRVGTRPVGRINFGGLVATGIPGFSPIVGQFGCGAKGDNSFDSIYGKTTHSYGGYIDGSLINASKIGDSNLYGVKLTDHRGKSYGVRYVYKKIGDNFTNDNTLIPNSLDNEIGIFFDDRDVSQGGFSLGNHIIGSGDTTGQITDTSVLSKVNYKGNRWRGIYAPDSLINASVKWESTTDTLTVKFYGNSIYNNQFSGTGFENIDDILGYLGFPKENGVIQLNDTFTGTTAKGSLGNTLSYTSRTQEDAHSSRTHVFYGVKGSAFTASHTVAATGIVSTSAGITNTANAHPNATGEWAYVLISSRMNWTTLLTDEVMAAATEAAINLVDVNKEEGVSFDCTDMLAADGRTLGEWGVSPDAIKLRAFNPNQNIMPISTMFNATIHKDKGIEAAHAEYGLYSSFVKNGAITGLAIQTAGTGYTPSGSDPVRASTPSTTGGYFGDEESDSHDAVEITSVDGSGGVTGVTINNAGFNFRVGDIIELRTIDLSSNGNNDCELIVTSIDASLGGKIFALNADNKPISDADLLLNKQVFCGYVPKTVLQIESKGRGFHANTPTPVLVDSTNAPIDTSVWAKNLKGVDYTRSRGDHIIPCINELSFGANGDIRKKGSINDTVLSVSVPSAASGTGFAKNTIYSTGAKGAVLSANAPTQAGSGFSAGVHDVFGGSGKGMKLNITETGGVPDNISTPSNFTAFVYDLGEGYLVGDALHIENTNTFNAGSPTGSATAMKFTVASVTSGEGAKIVVNSRGATGAIGTITVVDRGKNYAVDDYIRILPAEDGKNVAMGKVRAVFNSDITTDFVFTHDKRLHATLVPQSVDSNTQFARFYSVGERGTFYIDKDKSAVFRSDGTNLLPIVQNEEFINFFETNNFTDRTVMMTRNPNYEINGRRFHGSVDSEPIVYFRGAKDSVDHTVPLYFGGGFSGVTIDINDGTQNDYSSFYTHPYSNGPTGTTGIQHANEISTSFATIDCNALFAFFPGAALVNQNRGSLNPPAYNKDNILSPDVMAGNLGENGKVFSWVNSKYSAGVVRQKPTPLILQFAHPTARYEDYSIQTDYQNPNVLRHQDAPKVENKTMYIIYGPGQAIPFSESTYNIGSGSYPTNTQEPHPGTVVTVGNTWSKVPYNMNLPNALTNDANVFAPPTKTYQVNRHAYHYKVPTGHALNWSPPAGIPNVGRLEQRPEHGYHFGEHFNNPRSGKITATNSSEYFKAHPYKHSAMMYFGIAMSADMTWHMDGGYHPGGHWLDNQVAVNFKNHTSGAFVAKWGSTPVHPTAFRVSSKLCKENFNRGRLSGMLGNPVDGSTTRAADDFIIVDATRCQNGEELATIIGQAINENPGKGALKALGGTFMPSMGNANRQDRYGWTELTFLTYEINGTDADGSDTGYTGDESGIVGDTFRLDNFPFNHGEYFGDGTHGHLSDLSISVTASISGNAQNVLEQLPACGWIRTDTGGRDYFATGSDMGQIPAFAPYHSREVYLHSAGNYRVRFYLAPNRISGLPFFEDGYSFYDKCQGASGISFPPIMPSSIGGATVTVNGGTKTTQECTKIFVWSKAGVHRFNNENEATRDHMTQVHFSGLVDAIDRTRPVGAVGWAGERYSYLNSLKVETDGGGNKLYAAGLGAWYQKLGFSPYGSSNSCMGALGHFPHIRPMPHSPEASPRINGRANSASTSIQVPYQWNMGLGTNDSWHTSYIHNNSEGSPYGSHISASADADDTDVEEALNSFEGIYSRAFLVVSYESELPLVAKADRDNISATGDWLSVVSATKAGTAASTALRYAGTTTWDERIAGYDRFTAPANAGPHVEALITPNMNIPIEDGNFPIFGVYEKLRLLAETDADSIQGNITSGSANITGISSTSGIKVGMYIHHAAFPVNTQVIRITSGTEIQVSNNATATASSSSFFYITLGDNRTSNATPCLNPTGDLIQDLNVSPAAENLDLVDGKINHTKNKFLSNHSESTFSPIYAQDDSWIGDTNAFAMGANSPSQNFTVENIVWKRMDGGNLSLPAVNARGLGAIPFITHVDQDETVYTRGETIYGNNRFSFETTNSAMFPIIQAQELMHPQMATKNPDELRNVLVIPNEEMQFKSVSVEDDTGQIHTIEGGSPFGTIIRGFRKVSNRASEGLAPAVDNGDNLEPNLEIQLPDANAIPGNILVRSGFDNVQAYQHETIGSGGIMRPSHQGHNGAGELFDENFAKLSGLSNNINEGPKLGPTYDDYGWEHISQDLHGDIKFPDSTKSGWVNTTNNSPLNTAYKPHDRSLYFHITKSNVGHTDRYPVQYVHFADGGQTPIENNLTITNINFGTLTINTALNYNIWAGISGTISGYVGINNLLKTNHFEQHHNAFNTQTRFYAKFINQRTGESAIGVIQWSSKASTTLSLREMTPKLFKVLWGLTDEEYFKLKRDGVNSDFYNQLLAENQGTPSDTINIRPSYPMPAGTTRFFAARRMRDHAEVSGNSPDAKHQILSIGSDEDVRLPYFQQFGNHNISPMAIPRMGHHFVNATMAVMPGHWAHPAYQGLYHKHRACRSATLAVKEKTLIEGLTAITSTQKDQFAIYDPLLVIGSMTATPSGPSDIHGGAFTLMFESKIKHDGYGILASHGEAGNINKAGGHTIVLRAQTAYTFNNHFPDPSVVGAYQIIIQPNVFSNTLIGYHANGPANNLPDGSSVGLTSQQTALVVGIRELDTATGGLALILANATMADVRGCEIMINEVMLDHDPDHGSQFTNIPPLMTYNSLGVQGTEAPAFTRQSLPYHPQMFVDSTPGMTTNIPWWSIVHPSKPTTLTGSTSARGFRFLSHHRLDNFYLFIRANAGSIGAQLTLAGYPSLHPNVYDSVMRNISLNPHCTLVSNTTTVLTVDDASGFPIEPLYGEVLSYIDANGIRRTATWTSRSGNDATNMNKPKLITLTGAQADFTNNLTAGTVIRLSKQNDTFRDAAEIFTDSERSILTRTLPQTLQGSRDTNSLHVPDAYICLWSPNLGRPNAKYIENTNNFPNDPFHTQGTSTSQMPLNHMPQHFETVHYHDSTYYASLGPFALHIETPMPPDSNNATERKVSSKGTNTIVTNASFTITGGTRISVDGHIYTVNSDNGTTITVRENTANEIATGATVFLLGDGSPTSSATIATKRDAEGNPYITQAGTPGSFANRGSVLSAMLNNFWPCGSRGGPLVSRLDGYGYVTASWVLPTQYGYGISSNNNGVVWQDLGDDGSYDATTGVSNTDYDTIMSAWDSYTDGATAFPNVRPRPFGYRFGLRQPYNKPQWAMYGMRAYIEAGITTTNNLTEYQHGPLVQIDRASGTWTYAGGKTSFTSGGISDTYVGILEKQTNLAGMANDDIYGYQTRYSDGMRMTRPFGCPVRTLRNVSRMAEDELINHMLNPTVRREWWGDDFGKGIFDVATASQYYLVDWWGNTRGEDVRRMPVRGFGIKPAWDCQDVYDYSTKKIVDGSLAYTPFLHGYKYYNTKNIIAWDSGNYDYIVSSNAATAVAGAQSYQKIPSQVGNFDPLGYARQNIIQDMFFPPHANRVGSAPNGRGVRYPTAFSDGRIGNLEYLFNESIYDIFTTKGAVLSHNTAEPNIGSGYIRPRNDILQSDEVPRGISAKLGIEQDGLLQVESMVSDRDKTMNTNIGTFRRSYHYNLVSRSSPKIGLDVENVEGIDNNHVIITTEAYSLHSDRNVGHKGIINDRFYTHYHGTHTAFGTVYPFTETSMLSPYGGSYIMEKKNFLQPISLGTWGSLSTSGLVLWLRADSLDLEDGDSVASWTDINGIEFTQGTASAQPTFIADGGVAVNNKPLVDCDGNDLLSTPFNANLNTNEVSVFVVALVDVDDNGIHGIIESRGSSPVARSGFNLYGRMDSNNTWQWWGGADSGWTVVSSANNTLVAGQPSIITASITGGNGAGSFALHSLSVNGGTPATANAAFWKADAGNYQLGNVPSSFFLNGKIAEVIQFNRVLNDWEKKHWEGYLATKYNISGPTKWKSPNPYFSSGFNTDNNKIDKDISFLIRPIRVLNKYQVRMGEFLAMSSGSPQYQGNGLKQNYFYSTMGGKYGTFAYNMPNARASEGYYLRATNPDTNPPYAPIVDNMLVGTDERALSASFTYLDATNTEYVNPLETSQLVPSLRNDINNVIITENTLQHYRADASRRRTEVEDGTNITRKDFSIEPRFSQSLHPKGHKNDVSYNKGDHTGDGS